MTNQPLSGWRITITRAKDQSASLCDQLTQLGATVNECPMIETRPPSSWESLDSGIEKLNSYDWLIFTSTNAVDYFLNRLKELGRSDRLPSNLKVCAVGSATASRLSEFGIHADLVSSSKGADGILSALIETLGRGELQGLKFLFPRAKHGRDFLVTGLQELGAKIDLVEAYQTIRPEIDPTQLSVLLENQTDVIVFTSPSTIRNLAELVGNDHLPRLLKNVVVACIGPTTRQLANEKGLTVSIEPNIQTVQDLVDSIVLFAKNR